MQNFSVLATLSELLILCVTLTFADYPGDGQVEHSTMKRYPYSKIFPVKLGDSPESTGNNMYKVSTRQKRSLRPPAHLAEIFDRAYNNPDLGLSGDILYVARRICHTDFTIRRRLFRNKEILKAELNIYKKALKKTTNLAEKKVVHAVVSVHQVLSDGNQFDSTKLLDSRLLRIDDSGWISFDVTSSIQEWLRCRKCNKGFDVWVESVKPGLGAAKIARRMKFEDPDSKKHDLVPALTLFFSDKDEKDSGVQMLDVQV